MARVRLDGITKRYGDEVAVDGIDLTLRDGEVVGVIGPSGCGKTTTLRTIAGFETPTAGTVRFDGNDVTRVPPEDRNVGLVFQSYALFDNMTVLENVAFGPKMQGVGRVERNDRAMELLELLDIAEQAEKRPARLSGGQRQRVGLARALAIEPQVLLLDEPMTGLDEQLKRRLEREIGSLLNELGVTALYVTHDQREAMVMCDRIAVMNDGRVEQVGTPEEIYEAPASEFVAEFVGAANLLDVTVTGDRIDLGVARLSTNGRELPDGSATLVVRPETITVGRGPITGTVTDLSYVGRGVRTTVELPDGRTVTVASDPADRGVSNGDEVRLDIDTERVHLLSPDAR